MNRIFVILFYQPDPLSMKIILTILVSDELLFRKKFRKNSVIIFSSSGVDPSPSTSILTYCKVDGTFELIFLVDGSVYYRKKKE
jgi:hypothetical protein